MERGQRSTQKAHSIRRRYRVVCDVFILRPRACFALRSLAIHLNHPPRKHHEGPSGAIEIRLAVVSSRYYMLCVARKIVSVVPLGQSCSLSVRRVRASESMMGLICFQLGLAFLVCGSALSTTAGLIVASQISSLNKSFAEIGFGFIALTWTATSMAFCATLLTLLINDSLKGLITVISRPDHDVDRKPTRAPQTVRKRSSHDLSRHDHDTSHVVSKDALRLRKGTNSNVKEKVVK